MYHDLVYQILEENVRFFVRKSQKRPFLGLKKPSVWWYAGDTFLYGIQLTRVNRAGAGQGYQIQATRWRELSLLCCSTVVHFQYEYFHYRSVSPKWYRNTYDWRYFHRNQFCITLVRQFSKESNHVENVPPCSKQKGQLTPSGGLHLVTLSCPGGVNHHSLFFLGKMSHQLLYKYLAFLCKEMACFGSFEKIFAYFTVKSGNYSGETF